MTLWWWVGFSAKILDQVHSRRGARAFLDQLAQTFLLLWLFIVSGSFGFFIIATHDFFIALCGSLVFGFVQWNVIRLTNSSIHVAPHEYDAYLRAQRLYEAEKKVWDSLDKDTQKNTVIPKEATLELPSFFKPSLFFISLSVLSGSIWGIGLSTEYIIEIKGPPKEVLLYEILTRIDQATANSWMQIGGFIGLLIGCLPNFVRWINTDVHREIFTAVVEYEHNYILNLHQQHVRLIQEQLNISAFATQFLDPPFNKQPKVMGWINAQQCLEVNVPKWEPKATSESQEDSAVTTEDSHPNKTYTS